MKTKTARQKRAGFPGSAALLANAMVMVMALLACTAGPAQAAQLNPPTDLKVTIDETSGKIELTWNCTSTNVAYYEVERFQFNNTWVEFDETTNKYSTDAAFNLPEPDVNYSYRVRAIALPPYENSDFSNTQTIHVGKYVPPDPVLLTATPSGADSVVLTWSESCSWPHTISINYMVHPNGTLHTIETVGTNDSYTVPNLDANTTYDFMLLAFSLHGASELSNTLSATTPLAGNFSIIDPNINLTPLLTVDAPGNLTAEAQTGPQVELQWTDGCDGESGFRLMRQEGASGTMKQLVLTGPNAVSYVDDTVEAGQTYLYEVCAAYPSGDSSFSNIASVDISSASNNNTPPNGSTVMRFQVGSYTYYVNVLAYQMDVAPMAVENRILLPIRYVVESLGGTANWDGTTATVNCNSHTIQMWLNSNTASVDGASMPIDSGNPAVVPVVNSNRLMLPLRFVSENIGCSAEWTGTEAIITYPAVP